MCTGVLRPAEGARGPGAALPVRPAAPPHPGAHAPWFPHLLGRPLSVRELVPRFFPKGLTFQKGVILGHLCKDAERKEATDVTVQEGRKEEKLMDLLGNPFSNILDLNRLVISALVLSSEQDGGCPPPVSDSSSSPDSPRGSLPYASLLPLPTWLVWPGGCG